MPDGMNNSGVNGWPFPPWAELHFYSHQTSDTRREHSRFNFVAVADLANPYRFRVITTKDSEQCGSYEEIQELSVATVDQDNRQICVDAPNAYAAITSMCGEDTGPSTKELGEAIGYWTTIAMGGDSFTNLEPTGRSLLNYRQMFLDGGNAGVLKNWQLRYYGQLVGLDPFPIGTTNDDMIEAIRKQFLLSNFCPDTIMVNGELALKNDGLDGWFGIRMKDDLIEFFTYGDENPERQISLDTGNNAFEVLVDYDSELCASAIRSVHTINSKAARSLTAGLHDGKCQVRSSHRLVRQANEVTAKAIKAKEEFQAIADRVRRDPPKAIDPNTEVVDVCGRDFAYHGSSDAPSPVPGYVMEAWSSSVGMGHSISDVEKYDASDLLDSIIEDRCVRLVGPPGVGKTSIIQQLASRIGVPYFVITCHRDLPDEQFFGCYQIIDRKQVWVDGEFTKAMRCDAPLSFVAIEEGDHLDATKQSKMHAPLNGDAFVPGNGETLPVPAGMRFIMTANTSGHGDHTGRHASAMTSDTAFNSRFKSTFHVDYMDAEDECALLVQNGLTIPEAATMVQFAAATRTAKNEDNAMSQPVCLRHTLSYSRMRARGLSARKAFGLGIIGQVGFYDRQPCNELALQFLPEISK